ncbi:ankyrin repeat domain-containing protein [Leptospira idonii]|uniref:Uncharacterized protein n=1 Tax=Leptospira idonii TaxID=1193500 RepID=A0A4R9LXH9_9LEPT|nr:ankyrin repeat domain-containing protein [Leptospira idonii]TGN17771.1 hypothetical protein EHS15_16120 [Leptospira idonii]
MKFVICILLILGSLNSCGEYLFRAKVRVGLIDLDKKPEPGTKLAGYDYRIFQDTPVWELTKAALLKDTETMREIVERDKVDVNYQESRTGSTLLSFEVRRERYETIKTLLELGADPNIASYANLRRNTPVTFAAKISDVRILKILLQYKGDPNAEEKQDRSGGGTLGSSALYIASGSGKIENVKLLLSSGANLHYKDEIGQTPLTEALVHKYMNVVLYLLESGIEYKHQFGFVSGENYNTKDKYPVYIADRLRLCIIRLDSEQYQYKLKVIEFLKKNGIDYWSAPIPLAAKLEAKRMYPNDWEDYLKKY